MQQFPGFKEWSWIVPCDYRIIFLKCVVCTCWSYWFIIPSHCQKIHKERISNKALLACKLWRTLCRAFMMPVPLKPSPSIYCTPIPPLSSTWKQQGVGKWSLAASHHHTSPFSWHEPPYPSCKYPASDLGEGLFFLLHSHITYLWKSILKAFEAILMKKHWICVVLSSGIQAFYCIKESNSLLFSPNWSSGRLKVG